MQDLVITNRGRSVVAKLIENTTTLTFTKILVSSYDYSDTDLTEMSIIQDVKQESIIDRVTRTDEYTVEVMSVINNENLESPYHVKCVGLFAVDNNDLSSGEFLFGVSIETENPDYMPVLTGTTLSGISFRFCVKVDNAENVTIEVNPNLGPTYGDLENLETELKNLIIETEIRINTRIDELKEALNNRIDEVEEALEDHIDDIVFGETGVHGLRLHNNKLQYWDPVKNEWFDVPLGGGAPEPETPEPSGDWIPNNMPNVAWPNWYDVCYGNDKFVAVCSTDTNEHSLAYSLDGVTWALGTLDWNDMPEDIPNPYHNRYIQHVCYGNGVFVAIPLVATHFMYSRDGITWHKGGSVNSNPTGDFAQFTCICYGGGKFVALRKDSNKAVYSSDGINWTESLVPETSYWYRITYAKDKFVAFSFESFDVGLYSLNGINWIKFTLPSSMRVYNTYHNGDKFLSVFSIVGGANYSAGIMFSDNGINWVTGNSSDGNIPSGHICYGNGLYVSVQSSGRTMNSLDGITWVDGGAMPHSGPWTGACYGNGKFVAIARDDAPGEKNGKIGAYLVHPKEPGTPNPPEPEPEIPEPEIEPPEAEIDFINENVTNLNTDTTYLVNDVSITTNSSGEIPISPEWIGQSVSIRLAEQSRTSENGVQELRIPERPQAPSGLVGGDGQVTGVNNTMEYRLEGANNWTLVTGATIEFEHGNCDIRYKATSVKFSSTVVTVNIPKILDTIGDWVGGSMPFSASWSSICYGLDKFVAIASGKSVAAYSLDGINWEQSNMPSNGGWSSVCCGNGKFVAIASSSKKVSYSLDGITWSESALPVELSIYSVVFGNGEFVAVGHNSNKAVYSSDGINWSESTLPANTYWFDVAFGNGTFVAIAKSTSTAVTAYSSDGVNWEEGLISGTSNITSICYGNNKFVAVTSNRNQVAISSDGRSWVVESVPSGSWNQISYGNNRFVIVGATSNSKCLYGTDGLNWTETLMPAAGAWSSVSYGNDRFVAIKNGSSTTAYSLDE